MTVVEMKPGNATGTIAPDAVACVNCRFFSREPPSTTWGECRLSPPLMGENGHEWPLVELADWCGQHERKGEKAEPEALLPYIPAVLDLKAGDTLWLRSIESLSESAKDRLIEDLRNRLPVWVKVVICEQGLEPVAVLRVKPAPDGEVHTA